MRKSSCSKKSVYSENDPRYINKPMQNITFFFGSKNGIFHTKIRDDFFSFMFQT